MKQKTILYDIKNQRYIIKYKEPAKELSPEESDKQNIIIAKFLQAIDYKRQVIDETSEVQNENQ